MKTFVKSLPFAFAAACIFSGLAFAQAPAGASGSCKDGTYTTASSKRGACSGHGGVKDWFADQKSAPARGPIAAAPTSAPAAAPTSAPAEDTGKPRTAAAPGGGRGQVWVNSASKVYHCAGDEWYGKTEKGAYKSEAAAKAEGDRPARNKSCS
jgi:hypothetical protein